MNLQDNLIDLDPKKSHYLRHMKASQIHRYQPHLLNSFDTPSLHHRLKLNSSSLHNFNLIFHKFPEV